MLFQKIKNAFQENKMEKIANQKVYSEREIKCFRKVSVIIFKERSGEGGSFKHITPYRASMSHLKLCFK